MCFKQWVEYSTKSSSNKYPIEIGIKKVNYYDILVQPSLVRDLCKTGCKNYNNQGGCPPYSPVFTNIVRPDDSIFLVYGTFYPEYKTERVKASNSPYIHYSLQDQVLANLLNTIGIQLRDNHNCLFLGTGYCMGCKGIKCSFKNGDSICRNPQKRTYSLEATGVNVSLTLHKEYNIQLQWYRKNGPLNIPVTKCCAFIFNNETSEECFIHLFQEYINPVERGSVK